MFLEVSNSLCNFKHYLLSAHLIPFNSLLVFTSIYIILKIQ